MELSEAGKSILAILAGLCTYLVVRGQDWASTNTQILAIFVYMGAFALMSIPVFLVLSARKQSAVKKAQKTKSKTTETT